MGRILVLANSGFGKSSSIGQINRPDLGIVIKGLDPMKTFIISTKAKKLPWPGSAKDYPVVIPSINNITNRVLVTNDLKTGRRVITNNPVKIAETISLLAKSPFENIIWDDANYVMQDWYMRNALSQGWEAPKKIGFFMGKIFEEIEKYEDIPKNFFILAHGERVEDKSDGRFYIKFKTTGKMVDDYSTPEGMFEITLLGKSRWDEASKRIVKEYITNEDAILSSAKSPIGMFPPTIPNDFGLVVDTIKKYEDGEITYLPPPPEPVKVENLPKTDEGNTSTT